MAIDIKHGLCKMNADTYCAFYGKSWKELYKEAVENGADPDRWSRWTKCNECPEHTERGVE